MSAPKADPMLQPLKVCDLSVNQDACVGALLLSCLSMDTQSPDLLSMGMEVSEGERG